jgi:hypothetical protein
MSTFPTETQVINSILEGIKDAHENYVHWTNNGAWLSIAPEYMLNIFIGQHLSKLNPRPEVWFEITIKDLADYVSLKDQETTKKFIDDVERQNHQNEKIDIVLDDEKQKHSGVIIEVKNAISKYGEGCKKDIIRICNALSHESSLQYGVFAFFANDNKKDIDAIIDDLEVAANKTIKDENFNIVLDKFSMPIEKDTDNWSCAAVCFVLKKVDKVK